MSGIAGVTPRLRFRSADGRFGLALEAPDTARLLRYCVAAGDRETGGLLLGRYTPARDTATVTRVTGPAVDARAGPTWFHRGTRGLQRLVDACWKGRGDYYLGEWHFHPGAPPTPSAVDYRAMHSIAEAPQYNCPEPVLLILGGDPHGAWRVSVHVFRRGTTPLELVPS